MEITQEQLDKLVEGCADIATKRVMKLHAINADLLAACETVTARLGRVCEFGGSMQDFLKDGSMVEIAAVVAKIKGERKP